MEEIEVEIKGFSKKGHGMACPDPEEKSQKPFEVPGSCPGDRALIEVLKRRSRIKKAFLKEIKSPSPLRVQPRCPHVGTCGGCTWQQMNYSEQLAEKQRRIQELFHPYPVSSIVGMEDPWHYRGKMEFSFSQDREGNRFLGLNITGGRGRVVDLQECHIAPKWMMKVLAEVRSWWGERDLLAYRPIANTGSLQTLTLRHSEKTGSKMVILTVSGEADYSLTRKALNTFIKSVQSDEKTSVYLLVKSIAKGRPTRFYEMHLAGPEFFAEEILGKTLYMTPQAFFQPNSQMAEKLFTKAREMLNLQGHERVLDLYCGIGSIGLSLADYVDMVVGVEIVPAAVCDARYNIEKLGIENMQIYQTDVGAFLTDPMVHRDADVVIVDPPRVGLDQKTIAYLNETRPKKLLYISCNPNTQAENLKSLEGVKILEIAPFDQFPHTPHIENIILLTFE